MLKSPLQNRNHHTMSDRKVFSVVPRFAEFPVDLMRKEPSMVVFREKGPFKATNTRCL